MFKSKKFAFQLYCIVSLVFGDDFYYIQGDIIQLNNIDIRTCPDVVDSCIYICSDASTNPCHPENIYTIAFDTIAAARSRKVDVAIIDTAGRLQGKSNLMEELEEILVCRLLLIRLREKYN